MPTGNRAWEMHRCFRADERLGWRRGWTRDGAAPWCARSRSARCPWPVCVPEHHVFVAWAAEQLPQLLLARLRAGGEGFAVAAWWTDASRPSTRARAVRGVCWWGLRGVGGTGSLPREVSG